MPLSCLTAGRMTMSATLLHRTDEVGDFVPTPVDDINLDDYGTWEDSQDPLTGEIVKIWEPLPAPGSYDYIPPGDTRPNPMKVLQNIPCIARGIVDGGIRVAGTTERFGESYENIDFVKMWIPANIVVTKRDRITNIRDRSGRVRWLDEEYYVPGESASLRATVFNVNGVTPLLDAYNNVVEWFVLLERATEVD